MLFEPLERAASEDRPRRRHHSTPARGRREVVGMREAWVCGLREHVRCAGLGQWVLGRGLVLQRTFYRRAFKSSTAGCRLSAQCHAVD